MEERRWVRFIDIRRRGQRAAYSAEWSRSNRTYNWVGRTFIRYGTGMGYPCLSQLSQHRGRGLRIVHLEHHVGAAILASSDGRGVELDELKPVNLVPLDILNASTAFAESPLVMGERMSEITLDPKVDQFAAVNII